MMKEKKLTWDEVADIYDKENKDGRPARTLSMTTVQNWTLRRKDLFYVNDKDFLCLLKSKDRKNGKMGLK